MNECPICLEYLEGVIVKLKCNHKYHQICIEDWFNRTISNKNNLICPECNLQADILEIENINITKKQILELSQNNNTSSNEGINRFDTITKKCMHFCNIN